MDPFDASAITNWSDTPDTRHQLPALVRQLGLDRGYGTAWLLRAGTIYGPRSV